jgi:hypothetical protein
MVGRCLEKECSCMPAEIFDLSSFEDVFKSFQKFAFKKHNMMITKWLVGEKLPKNSSLYIEATSTILSSMHREIDVKMFDKIQILSFRIFFSIQGS